jgi:hypothetical protein
VATDRTFANAPVRRINKRQKAFHDKCVRLNTRSDTGTKHK